MTKEDKVIVYLNRDEEGKKVNYKQALKLCEDQNYRYDIHWCAEGDKDGMSSGNTDNLHPNTLKERVEGLAGFWDRIHISRKTLRMSKVEQGDIALASADKRRRVYDPDKFTEGLEADYGKFYWHNVIVVNDPSEPNSELGRHHHDYVEMFVVPVGQFKFVLIDPEDPRNPRSHSLYAGTRLVIPEGIDHVVKGVKDSVLLGFGNVEFDPKRLIASDKKILETMLDEL